MWTTTTIIITTTVVIKEYCTYACIPTCYTGENTRTRKSLGLDPEPFDPITVAADATDPWSSIE